MPELPEVETIVRGLAAALPGRRIVRVEGRDLAIEGRVIHAVRRHGKYIVLDLDGGMLAIHLRMTGKLMVDGLVTKWTRVVFHLDAGTLVFEDIRRFGTMTLLEDLPSNGPDALAVPEQEFVQMFRGRRGRIKPLLLNQRFVSGLGNIYTDESLFRAGIHPRAQAARLSRPRLRKLHAAIHDVLTEAIAAGGSSISDYVSATGDRGSFQVSHAVYGRAEKPCPRCGTLIRRIVLGQRGTHYCSTCQRV